jgi:deoxyribodipyrimidine photo-lyase
LHAPWTAPADVLKKAGIRLGKDYPEPIVDHASARKRFLLVAGDHLKRGV